MADRENGRIQCFLAESGEFIKEIKKEEFGGEVFAVSYAPEHGRCMWRLGTLDQCHCDTKLQSTVNNNTSVALR